MSHGIKTARRAALAIAVSLALGTISAGAWAQMPI